MNYLESTFGSKGRTALVKSMIDPAVMTHAEVFVGVKIAKIGSMLESLPSGSVR